MAATYNDFVYAKGEGLCEILGYTGEASEVVIPLEIEGLPVKSIGFYAFNDCKNITDIEIPDGVTAIGNYAFNNCSGLTSINLPKQLTTIGKYGFARCSNLKEVVIPEGVTFIGQRAFVFCSNLTSVEIPKSVKIIKLYAFSGCSKLSTVKYHGTQSEWDAISIEAENTPLLEAELILQEKDFSGIVIKDKTTVSDFVLSLGQGYQCVVYDKSGNAVEETEFLGTGMKYEIRNSKGEVIYTKDVAIYGDINGDGKISATDYLNIKRALANPSALSELQFMAADVSGDGFIKAVDYARVKRYMAGSYDFYS